MYPYFQKTDLLFGAERTSDPIRTFLSENPAFGTLLFQVNGGQGAFPIPGASVLVQKELADGQKLTLSLTTDKSGKTEPISLPAPSRELSRTPGQTAVFAAYQAEISAPHAVTVTIRDLPVFDGVTTIQPVLLLPDLGRTPPEIITDTEPDL